MEKLFFSTAFTAYTLAMVFYIGFAVTRRDILPKWARWLVAVAVISHVASLIVRTYYARQLPQHGWYVPWSNWFESFSFFSLVISAEFLILLSFRPLSMLGAFVSPLAWISMIVAINSPFGRQIPTLPPALQSYWMAIHVPVMFISYSAFALAFCLGLAYLLQEHQLKSKKPSRFSFGLPPLDELDALIYKVILLAFPVLTLGVLLGAAWAYDAWGRYWGWDPKETWAFITWVVYLIYLHMRIVSGWRGKKSSLFVAGGVWCCLVYLHWCKLFV